MIEEQIDVPRLLAMNEWWADHPPLHRLIECYLDVQPRRGDRGNNQQFMLDQLPRSHTTFNPLTGHS